MSGRPALWSTALLVLVNAGLGAVVVTELTGTLTIAPQVTAAPPLLPELDAAHEPALFEPPSRDQLDAIAARPLFSSSRRPFAAAAGTGTLPEALDGLPPLELIGVLLVDQRRAALIRRLDGSAPGWVREEEVVAGWRLEKVERSRVHLAAGDRLEVVELRADTAVPAEARVQPHEARAATAEAANNDANEGVESDAEEPTETEAAQSGRERDERVSEKPRR
jgi:hypothetical protein